MLLQKIIRRNTLSVILLTDSSSDFVSDLAVSVLAISTFAVSLTVSTIFVSSFTASVVAIVVSTLDEN